MKSDNDEDELEAFMGQINTKVKSDNIDSFKRQIASLEQECSKLEKLIEIAKPFEFKLK